MTGAAFLSQNVSDQRDQSTEELPNILLGYHLHITKGNNQEKEYLVCFDPKTGAASPQAKKSLHTKHAIGRKDTAVPVSVVY